MRCSGGGLLPAYRGLADMPTVCTRRDICRRILSSSAALDAHTAAAKLSMASAHNNCSPSDNTEAEGVTGASWTTGEADTSKITSCGIFITSLIVVVPAASAAQHNNMAESILVEIWRVRIFSVKPVG